METGDKLKSSETLIGHLLELRTRLLHSFAALIITFLCLLPWAADLYALLAQPMLAKLPQGGQMIAIDVITPFFVPLKVALMVAFLISLPYILYQMWLFAAPGMLAHEKRMILPLIVVSFLLFLCGMAFAYFAVFPMVFGFVTAAAPTGVAVMTDIDKYLSFVMGMFIAFGATFEVPVVVVALAWTKVVTLKQLREARSYVIVGAFILGAILTPPDIISQFMLAIPLWLLYEAGIVVVSWVTKDEDVKTAGQ